MEAWLASVQHGEAASPAGAAAALRGVPRAARAALVAELAAAGARGEVGLAALVGVDGAVDAAMLDDAACDRLRALAANRQRRRGARAAALRLLAARAPARARGIAEEALLAGAREPWEVALAAVAAAAACLAAPGDAAAADDDRARLLACLLARCGPARQVAAVAEAAAQAAARFLDPEDPEDPAPAHAKAALARAAARACLALPPPRIADAVEALDSPLLRTEIPLLEAFCEIVPEIARAAPPDLCAEPLGRGIRDLEGVIDALKAPCEEGEEHCAEDECEGRRECLHLLPSLLRGYLETRKPAPSLVARLRAYACCAGEHFPRTWRSWHLSLPEPGDQASEKALERAAIGLESLELLVARPAKGQEADLWCAATVSAAAWAGTEVGFEVAPRCQARAACEERARSLASRLSADGFEARAGDRQLLWPYLRELLSAQRWRTSESLACGAMLRLVQRSARADVRGEDAVGHLVPMLLPVAEHPAPSISTGGLVSMGRLVGTLMTSTEFRWHGELLLDRAQHVCATSRDIEVLELALPLLLAALAHAERIGAAFRMRKHLAALEALLPCAELATDMGVLAIIISEGCEPLVSRLQLQSVTFLPQCLDAAERGIGVGHPAARRASMRFLLTLVKATSPRIRRHQDRVVALAARHQFAIGDRATSKGRKQDLAEELRALPELLAFVREHGSAARLEEDVQKLAGHVNLDAHVHV